MAFNSDDVRIVTLPGGNQGPGLVILHDAAVASNTINTAYFARRTALASRGDEAKDYAVQKRYAAIAGQVKAGRGRDKTGASDVGAVLVAVGNNAPVMARLRVTTSADGLDTITVA